MFFFPVTAKARARYKQARELYRLCLLQAREPLYYSQYAVPDSFDGRFDLLSIHAGMMIIQLNKLGKDGEKLAQALFDEMFVNMDQTCREMGVGDLSIPKHMKRMMKAFKGRALTYDAAMQAGQADLQAALQRNLYGTVAEPVPANMEAMANYLLSLRDYFSGLKLEAFTAGSINMPMPIHFKNEFKPDHDKTSQAA